MNPSKVQDIRDGLNYRLSNLSNSIEASDDEVRIAFLICETDQLRELLQAYRDKRAVDGLNGRVWDACKHHDADQLIGNLESKQQII